MKLYIKFLTLFLFSAAALYSYDGMAVKADTVPHWTYNRTDGSHNFAILYNVTVKIDADTALTPGDYIGVFFDSSGTAACAGYGIWVGGTQSINVTAWADDPSTSKKEGFAANETIKWKLFKKKTGQTIDIQVTIFNGPITFSIGATSVLSSILTKKTDVLPPWVIKNTGVSHIIAVPVNVIPSVSGTKLTDGDYIGVFYDSSGTLACGGYARYNANLANAVTAWGDDKLTTAKDGFIDAEVFKWKLWRASDNKQFIARAYYKKGETSDSTFATNGMSILDSLIASVSDTTYNDSVVTITCNFTFGDGDITKSINYRMIGLPCNGTTDGFPISLDNSVFYGRTANTDWVAFWDNGTGDYIAYSEGTKDKFIFTPGKAFWVLSKYSFTINQLKAKPVVPGSDGTYSIPLIKGWNMISNPFNGNIDWNSLIPLNSYITDPLWDYNEQGKYVLPSGFLPYRGYYFYNRKGLDSLKVPKPAAKETKLNITQRFNVNNLKDPITITLKNNGASESQAYITINQAASYDLDDLDQFTPPVNFEDAKVYLYNDELNSLYKNMFIEARPAIGEGQAFDLRVKHNMPGAYSLVFEGLEKYSANELYLINKRSLKFYSLKENPALALSSTSKTEEFILAIGSKAFLGGMQIDIKPFEYALYQNYPNPFNPATVLSWQLMADSKVTLKIYDLLGRELFTLLSENQKAGHHQKEFSIDKFKLASGVYFYRLQAKAIDGSGEFSSIKKMAVIK